MPNCQQKQRQRINENSESFSCQTDDESDGDLDHENKKGKPPDSERKTIHQIQTVRKSVTQSRLNQMGN